MSNLGEPKTAARYKILVAGGCLLIIESYDDWKTWDYFNCHSFVRWDGRTGLAAYLNGRKMSIDNKDTFLPRITRLLKY